MTARIALVSLADTSSFLVPVLGFAERADADRYIELQAAAGTESFASGDGFEPLHLSARSYVPAVDVRHDDWETNRVFGMPIMSKPVWVKLRDKNRQKAPGAYNLALMVEGVRSFFRHVERSCQGGAVHVPHPGRAAGLLRCLGGFDGRTLQPLRKTGAGLAGEEHAGQRLFAARTGRGILYSRVANFNSAGELSGFTLRVVQVEFSILDRDTARDDMMRVTVMKQIAHSHRADDKPKVSTDHMDDTWKALVERAETGFNRWCREEPEDVEAWRKMFFDQKAKALADRELNLSGPALGKFSPARRGHGLASGSCPSAGGVAVAGRR